MDLETLTSFHPHMIDQFDTELQTGVYSVFVGWMSSKSLKSLVSSTLVTLLYWGAAVSVETV